MSTYNSAVPKIIFNGINDRSRRPFIRPETTFAQHTPLYRLFTETGPTETTYVGNDSDGFASIYGQETLNHRSKYFNTQSLFALETLAEGNGFYVKRLKPEDAGNSARITLAIEMVRDSIPAVLSALSGFNYPDAVTDSSNSPIGQADSLVEGYRARIIQIKDNTSEVGTQQVLPGTMISSLDGSQSVVYPIMEIPASFFGEPGNNLGLKIWPQVEDDPSGYDQTTTDEFKTRLYRVQFLELFQGMSTPTVIKTKYEGDYVDVSFDEGVFSEALDRDLTIDDTLIEEYADDGVESGLSPLYSPFSEVFVYRDNIHQVQDLVWGAELEVNPAIAMSASQASQIDFLTFVQADGDPYHSIKLEGPIEGGILLGKASTVYAAGGTDGTTDFQEYVKQVDLENLNFGKLGDQYENVPLYQFGVLYDSGLPMASKYKAMNVLAARKDMQYRFTTMIEGERPLTATEEISRTQALMTRLKAFPESTLFGTPVCRAMIVLQSGKMVGGNYNKQVPQLLDYMVKQAKFAGAGDGIMRTEFAPDEHPNNIVGKIKRFNVPFFNARATANLWLNGATYSITYDHRSNYYPCIRTVINDDTSVLLSPITVDICCVIMRLIHKVHAKFSGNASLTPAQLIERCDEEILDRTRDLFGSRVDIIPQTFISTIDANNGTSWSCKVTVAAENPRTTLNFELETIRRSSLAEG